MADLIDLEVAYSGFEHGTSTSGSMAGRWGGPGSTARCAAGFRAAYDATLTGQEAAIEAAERRLRRGGRP